MHASQSNAAQGWVPAQQASDALYPGVGVVLKMLQGSSFNGPFIDHIVPGGAVDLCGQVPHSLPHLHQDWAHPCEICTRTGPGRVSSKPSPPEHTALSGLSAITDPSANPRRVRCTHLHRRARPH